MRNKYIIELTQRAEAAESAARDMGVRVEGMEKDAARYRWLRLASADIKISNRFVNICESEPATPELFDAAIDAALTREQEVMPEEAVVANRGDYWAVEEKDSGNLIRSFPMGDYSFASYFAQGINASRAYAEQLEARLAARKVK